MNDDNCSLTQVAAQQTTWAETNTILSEITSLFADGDDTTAVAEANIAMREAADDCAAKQQAAKRLVRGA